MTKIGAPISLASSQLGEARHVCAFFKSREDEYSVTLPFIKEGFEAGDKAIHIIDPARRADHLQRMASFGIDTVCAQQSGQFELHDWRDTFFSDGPFQLERQLGLLEDVLTKGRQQGLPVTRYIAHAEWALQDGASLDDLLEFEAGVNHIWAGSADTVVCAYDLTRYSADTVIDVFRTHPAVIIGGILQQNPFFVQPDDFLRELRERRATGGVSPLTAA
jgi:hypothetical protein